ncbi:MAG TPA: hypothetical protein VMD99_10115 [Terriglobales bacterium]|nr:hypothetical protein [Terriglobales bacterium]
MIDQIRASKLPSGMMQFAARGALQVSPAENIEILVYLATHNKVFGELARMTFAGWDEKSCRAAAADPQTPAEVLNYMISLDNLRPALAPALLENPSVPEGQIAKLALSAGRETIEAMLKSARVRSCAAVLQILKANPYLKKQEAEEIEKMSAGKESEASAKVDDAPSEVVESPLAAKDPVAPDIPAAAADPAEEEAVSAYVNEHAGEIAADANKPFQAVGGIVELLGSGYFPVTEAAPAAPAPATPAATAAAPGLKATAAAKKPDGPKRENALQKISHLDVKGRIQLALKGNKEERSLLIRDGTKVVALAVLEAPKLSDGEVEKFASQKNVLEAVLRQIPLKRRFMKNYIVVRNLVANPRTPLDLGLGLMKNLLAADLKNISANKDVSETIRKLALKMYKQKLDAANKK